MQHRTKFSLTALALAVLAASGQAQTVISYHSASATQHQLSFNSLSANGYRIQSIAVHGSGKANARYACVWRKATGPKFVACHAKNFTEFLAWWAPHANNGFRIQKFCGSKPDGSPAVFAAVMVKDGVEVRRRFAGSKTQFEDDDKQHREAGFELSWCSKYGNNWAGIWEKPLAPTPWNRNVDLDAVELQERFDALTPTGVRMSFVTPDENGRYMAIWRDDRIGGYSAHAGLTSSQYLTEKAKHANQGLVPILIQAAGKGTATRYCAIFAKSGEPLPRAFTATGPAVPELAAYDQWMRGFMQKMRVRAAGFAVARHGKLMYARGYTNAEAGYPITKPTSVFRIASTAKPLTSILIHQAYTKTALTPETRVQTLFGLQTSQLGDPRIPLITFDHLLRHRGGWDRNSGPKLEPTFMDNTIAGHYNLPVPISKWLIFNYMMKTQKLEADPGTAKLYSNFGYSILGNALEILNPGKSYADVLRRDLFQPLGLSRPHNGESALGKLHPLEVRYDKSTPSTAASVVHADRRRVAFQYGGWNQRNLDAHGGLVMAAPDYAKILAAFDFGGNNPILDKTGTTAMWEKPADGTWLRGWFEKSLDDEHGDPQRVMSHGGNLWGLNAMIFRREDGLSFVLFCNRWVKPEMDVDVEGKQLNDIANRVRKWPTKDLFPDVGIPAFRIPSPQLDAPLTSQPNVTPDGIPIRGKFLGEIHEATLRTPRGRTIAVTNTDPARVVTDGLLVAESRTAFRLFPPQGLPAGAYTLSVQGQNGTSNRVPLILITDGRPTLVVPSTVIAGRGLEMLASRGSLSNRTLVQLTFSPDETPSVIPGVGSLGIGNQFATLFRWGGLTPTDANTGTVRWSAPTLGSLRGLQVHFQCYLIDAAKANPLPVSTTNIQSLELK